MAAFAVCAALASGCVTQGTHDLVVAERDRLDEQRRGLEGQVERLTALRDSLTREREQLLESMEDQRIAKGQLEGDVRRLSRAERELAESLELTSALLAEREAEIARMRNTYDALVSDLQEELTAGQIQIEQLRSGLNVNLSQEILFASGSAVVNTGGIVVLRKVGSRLAAVDYPIKVVGHTDNVPIGSRYPSNWELAAARASSVARLLADVGVDPARLAVVSRGEYQPVASNETEEGRALNRRIEIQLEPVPPTEDADDDSAAPVASAEPDPGPAPDSEPGHDPASAPAVEPVSDPALSDEPPPAS